jgi:peptide/nickel transport system substrate-binding protein
MLDLKREWAGTNRGTGDFTAVSLTAIQVQLRPEYANPRDVRDLRVRRALAHGVDKQTFRDTIWGGELTVMDSIFEPTSDYYPVIDRAIAKYPYDSRASERLMSEAGYTRGPDGFFTGPTEGKLTLELAAPQLRPERPVVAAGWRQIGFDMQERALSQVLSVDPETRSTFPALGVATSGAHDVQQLALYRSSEVSSAETRWRGENRGGWVSPEYDRLVQAFFTTMDPGERVQQRAQIGRILTEELPSIVLSYNPNAHAYLASVKGLTKTSLYTTGRTTWNIERWELQ